MKKTFIIAVFCVLSSQYIFPIQEKFPQTADLRVNMEFRTLQPGEVVIVRLTGREDVKLANVYFLESKYTMGQGQDPAEWLAFVGLDLGIKPGTYTIDISVLFDDGIYQNISREILVLDKPFPLRKLWVEQEYVTPPPEEMERIRIESELLREIYNIFSPHWLGEGNFIIPSAGEVMPNFGERRIFNNQPRSSHSGVDISSPYGSPVRASNSGRIVLANNLYFAGKTVIIDHGLGVFTLYCHFSKITAKRGEWIKKGDVIGEVGVTGRVTGPHLHWGVRIFGNRVDPFSLVSLNFE
ncbi:MAG: M23 family metallopeptidase [Candidatus Aminicenantes bacterium]|nr:M23 family metallopeptidase [Candidatus Aminicenantes bacterium]MDH5744783.1 M23 family metallopeptidase [Candidatus Aminicenantes bacterium]